MSFPTTSFAPAAPPPAPAEAPSGIVTLAFTDIEETETIVRVEFIADLLNRNFSNLLLCVIENVFKVAHCCLSLLI